MLLDDHGHGHVMITTPTGAVFSVDTDQLDPLIQLLEACRDTQQDLALPADMWPGDPTVGR